MCKTDPIKNAEDIRRLKNYFLNNGKIRNYTMVTVALNTSLRIGDLLGLKWGDVLNFKVGDYREHIILQEQKTGKRNIIALNKEAIQALEVLKKLSRTSLRRIIFLKAGLDLISQSLDHMLFGL